MLPPPPPKRQAYTALPAEVVEESIQPPPPSYKPRPPPPPPPPRREIKSLEDGTYSATNVNPTSTQTVNESKHILEESKNKSTNPFDDLSEDEGQPLRGGSVMRMKFTLPKTSLSLPSSGTLMLGEPESLIYHKNNFSEPWFVIFLIIHTVQFIMMLSAANEQLSSGAFAVIVLLVVAVIILVLLSRWYTRKSRLSSAKNVEMRNGVCTPDDEADDIDDRAIYCLIVACVLEGIAYAIFAATVAGRSSELNKSGFYTQDTILQILRFASITLLALHRIIRPANRIDPMRIILELEVVSVCWDAIDGSTIFELLDDSTLADTTANAARALMVIWYFSVGARIGLMLIAHLKPTSPIYPLFVTYPLQLAKQMTVDRTLQAVRLRSIVIMIMAGADFYAAILRIVLWSNDQLDSLQQEMMLKNFFFLISFGMAYAKYSSTSSRKWNTRIFDLKYFTIHLPKRATQLRILRWLFTIFYLIISVSLTAILVDTTSASTKWIVNLVFDLILLMIFFVYCQNIHIKSERNDTSWLIFPREKFLAFPSTLAIGLGSAMLCSLLFARIPGIYYHYNDLSETGDDYNEALMCVSLAVIPIAFYNLYWSTGYMLFRKEFTAVPNNYHGIHDPTIKLIATATMTEGALDVLSCATLMELAANDLPTSVNGAIVLFCLLEIINGCQCFALQVTLSGGHDDTPLDLVRWNAYLRTFRVLIDSGAIVLRVVLWIKYNAVSSVFLVKNIYNLIHTVTQIERWKSVTHYPKETLFSEFVSPYEWYGYTREQWKKATTETIAAQLRSEQKALLKGLFVRRKETLLRDF